MKRFTRYLYEYCEGKCIQNVGFVKVEETKESIVFQIYGTDCLTTGVRELEILLFYMVGERCIGIPMGNIQNMRAMTAHRVEYDKNDKNIAGIILRKKDGENMRYYAGIWEEQRVNVEQVSLEEEQLEELVTEYVNKIDEIEEKEVETEQKTQPVYKITRKDIVNLPRQEWKLANNHFLVHGCRNFHHLVSFEKDGTCWLGVPGIYHKQEEQAAKAFGFGQFMKPDEGDVVWEEEEKAEDEEFGYWCRPVHNVIKR